MTFLSFDNDDVGHRKSNKYLKEGKKVFLWNKLMNDLAKKELDPSRFKVWFKTNIKDMNKLMQCLNIHYKDLDKYFSDDVFDTFYTVYDKTYRSKKTVKEPTPMGSINWDTITRDLKK